MRAIWIELELRAADPQKRWVGLPVANNLAQVGQRLSQVIEGTFKTSEVYLILNLMTLRGDTVDACIT